MTKEQFIEVIAKAAIKYAPKYNIKVVSPIIAQACLESAYGTSTKAQHHNYFGLKYRKDRVTCHSGYFSDGSKEQRADGSYEPITTDWYAFPNLEAGVEGYFQFTNIGNYMNLKGVTDPHTYLVNIRADGYATSQTYVEDVFAVVQKWSLTKYDKELSTNKEVSKVGYTNSPLVDCTVLSPNHSGQRTHAIDRITPHCVVGQLRAENIGACFPKGRDASCNYGIGTEGRVCLIVEEKNRSWCSSSNANDQRAITIECASDKTEPYAFNSAVYNKLIELCVDICRRNGKKKLLWIDNKDKALAYNPTADEMLLTVHRWFAAKSCPGNWMYQRMGELASTVTAKLGGTVSVPQAPSQPIQPATQQLYRVRKTWADSKSQKGAYKILENAKKCADENPGYSVFDESGKVVYSGKTQAQQPAAFQPYLVRVKITDLNIRKGPGTNYAVVKTCPPNVYTIVEEADGKGATKWGRLKSGVGWISLDYATKV